MRCASGRKSRVGSAGMRGFDYLQSKKDSSSIWSVPRPETETRADRANSSVWVSSGDVGGEHSWAGWRSYVPLQVRREAGRRSRCSRWDQEKKREENDDSMRITSAEELFSLVREEDISVRCSTGCYRLAVTHWLSYCTTSHTLLQCSLCKTASVPGEIGKRRGREGEGMVEGATFATLLLGALTENDGRCDPLLGCCVSARGAPNSQGAQPLEEHSSAATSTQSFPPPV